jgi:DNA-binding transcriptional ArsR family regulator
MANERALDAIGDPTRRRILELVAPGERSVRELTDELDITQSGVSQHLRVLREAGLVTARTEGTRRLYRVDLDNLADVRAWVDGFWDGVLTAFAHHLDLGGTEPPTPTPEEGP